MINIKTMDEGYTLDEVKAGEIFQPYSTGFTYMKCSSGDFVDLETGELIDKEEFIKNYGKTEEHITVQLYKDVELRLRA